MDKILADFQDPSWWFTGLFYLSLTFILPWAYKKLSVFLKTSSRNRTRKKLVRIKAIRFSKYKVHQQIAIEQSYFIIFCVTCFIYVVLMFVSPLAKIFSENMILGFALSLPIYISEIKWLFHQTFVESLIKRAEKIAYKKQNSAYGSSDVFSTRPFERR